MSEHYESKRRFGRESPIQTSMKIRIVNHYRADIENVYDIRLYNYVDCIGENRYCSYCICDDRIYFRFYATPDNDIHRYKMFAVSARKGNFKLGNVIGINVVKNIAVEPFISEFDYPVYYLASTDEYYIDRCDVKRKKLFNPTKTIAEVQMGVHRSIDIDGRKLRREIMKRGFTMKETANGCGVGVSTINTYMSKNYISPAVKEVLSAKYNILYDAYKVDDSSKEEIEVVRQPILTDDDWEHLYKVIYSATYEAMKQALSGE